jgi:Zn-dependent peptidase ImmA (M78 family)
VKTYNKAEKILLDLGITSPIDINLDIIAWSQGVKVNRRTLENCEAWIIGDTEEAIISVNSNTATSRQRFSIAHELGHWQNDRGASFICTSSDMEMGFNSCKFRERQANSFAADLLFPDFLFQPKINRIPILTWKTIWDLSHEFRMSLTATAIKCIDSNAFPIILAVYKDSKRLWFKRSIQVPEKWFPRNEIAVPESIKNKDVGKYPVSANFWFDADGSDDFEVNEQTLQKGGTIFSLITIEDDCMRDLDF